MCRAREVLDDLATPGAAEVLAIPTPPEITPMPVNRHQQARTTPAIRQELRESPLSMAALARRYHLTQATGRQWRRRAETTDRSHRPHHLHTTCTPPARRPRRRWWWPGASPGCCPGMTAWR